MLNKCMTLNLQDNYDAAFVEVDKLNSVRKSKQITLRNCKNIALSVCGLNANQVFNKVEEFAFECVFLVINNYCKTNGIEIVSDELQEVKQ